MPRPHLFSELSNVLGIKYFMYDVILLGLMQSLSMVLGMY